MRHNNNNNNRGNDYSVVIMTTAIAKADTVHMTNATKLTWAAGCYCYCPHPPSPPPLQPFYGPFSGTTRVSQCHKKTSGLYRAKED